MAIKQHALFQVGKRIGQSESVTEETVYWLIFCFKPEASPREWAKGKEIRKIGINTQVIKGYGN